MPPCPPDRPADHGVRGWSGAQDRTGREGEIHRGSLAVWIRRRLVEVGVSIDEQQAEPPRRLSASMPPRRIEQSPPRTSGKSPASSTWPIASASRGLQSAIARALRVPVAASRSSLYGNGSTRPACLAPTRSANPFSSNACGRPVSDSRRLQAQNRRGFDDGGRYDTGGDVMSRTDSVTPPMLIARSRRAASSR